MDKKTINIINYRCNCGRLLLRGLFEGQIEIKCPKCKKLNKIRASEKEKADGKNMETVVWL